MRAGHGSEDALGFVFGEDGGKALRAVSADGVNGVVQFFLEDFAIEEEDGGEGLVLGGGSDVFLDGEVGEEVLYFGRAHVFWVAFFVEEDVAGDPIDVGVFGSD